MKIKLLVFCLLFFPVGLFAQATAYPVPNIEQCGNPVFNLNQQTPIVLGNQGPFPTQFEVSYYTTLSGAQAGSGRIPFSTASQYTLAGESQTIYIRVQNGIGNAWDVTSFVIRNNDIPPMIGMPDIIACGPVILPPPAPGTSFNTGPNGTNPPVENPYFFTMYVHNSNGYCSSDYPFTITILPPGPYPTQDVSACSSYVLPYNGEVFYYADPEGAGMIYTAGTQITTSMTMYVIPADPNSCFTTNSFDIHIGDPQVNQPTTPLYGCFSETAGYSTFDFHSKFFEIATVPGINFSLHTSLEQAQDNQGALDYEQPIAINSAQTVYVRVSNGGDCFSIVTLDLIPESCPENMIYGLVHYDAFNNGCTNVFAGATYVEVIRTAGDHTVSTYTDESGQYFFLDVQEGDNTFTVVAPENFTASLPVQTFPVSGTLTWTDAVPVCLSGANSVNEVEALLVPHGTPRPGKEVSYSLLVKNTGTAILSATAVLQYDMGKLDFVNSSFPSVQGTNTITFNFTDFYPLHTMSSLVTFNVKPQPDVVLGEQLTFTASIVPVPADGNQANNTAQITQTVVNSFDPNDIIVQEGAYIDLDQADDYLHYTIRFQNEGTADAHDVLIKNRLSQYLDWSTFQPVASSHSVNIEIGRVGADVSFMFYNIHLPPNVSNDPDLIGYVSYKIKPLPGFAPGDIIANNAAIYFDDNAPVQTNTVTTQIEALGVAEHEFDALAIYPNPSRDVLQIDLKTASKTIGVAVYDLQGKLILESDSVLADGKTSVAVSEIQSGMYLLKVTADGKSTVKKWVKL